VGIKKSFKKRAISDYRRETLQFEIVLFKGMIIAYVKIITCCVPESIFTDS